MLGSNPSAVSVASTDRKGGCYGIPFSFTDRASYRERHQSAKSWGCGGQSPCSTACFRSESGRPLIMRALFCYRQLRIDFRIARDPAAITVGKLARPVTQDSLVKRPELATRAARPIAAP